MQVLKTISEMQAWSKARRKEGRVIAVVPTMGYLHAGHLSLVECARLAGADAVVVTIFVNPTQFGPNEDFAKYPRDLEHDLQLCESKQVDAVFHPEPSEMYPPNASTWVVEESLSKGLCAKTRPTHFRGVTTVVAKLFNATLPDIAVFGQKDAQQVRVLRRMVRDLNFPIKVVTSPIVRESDGLAMSSRNKYLSEDERRRALVLSHALQAASDSVSKAGADDLDAIVECITAEIEAAEGKVDYVETVDNETLEPLSGTLSRPTLVAVAAYFGKTRLIDNVIIAPQLKKV
jgi:pantoate--beta-alanine ligase